MTGGQVAAATDVRSAMEAPAYLVWWMSHLRSCHSMQMTQK